MFDSNWKTWIILVIAFLGASFELLKHLPTKENVAWDKENLHYGLEGKPYSVHELPAKMKAPVRPVHIAGDAKVLQDALNKYVAATTPTKTEAPPPPKTAAKKKKENPDDYEDVIDPVTGKLVHRKKKKETKKEEEKPAVVAAELPVLPQIPQQEDPNKADPGGAIGAAIQQMAQTGELPQPIKPSTTPPFSSLTEWEHILLPTPELAETKVFIQDFQNHTVTADVFYQIAKMMIADTRPAMQSLGILCAGSAQSVLSFEILSDASATGSSTVKGQATQLLTTYSTSIADLTILQSILRGADTNSETSALTELNASANHFLSTSTQSTGGSTTGSTANAAQFQPFLAILRQLGSSANTTVASQANQSLNVLDGLLGTTPSNVAVSTP